MSEYTPTTEEVRSAWMDGLASLGAEFDSWLAEHDAERDKATINSIIALLESKLMGKAVEHFTGEIGWSSFEGDVIALIKGENNE